MVDEKNQHEEDGVGLINSLFEAGESTPVEEPKRAPAKPATPRKRSPRKPQAKKTVEVVEDTVTVTSVDGVPAAAEEVVTVAEVEVPVDATSEEVAALVTAPAGEDPEFVGYDDYVDAINDEQPEGQPSIRETVKEATRVRPDQIVVGEVREGSAHDFTSAAGGNGGHVPPSDPAGSGASGDDESPVTPTLASVFTGKTKAPWLLTATIANALAVLSLVLWFIPGGLAVLVGLVAASVAWRKKEKPSGWVKGNFWFSLVTTAFSAIAVLFTLVFVFVMVIFAWIAAASSHYDVSPYMY